MGSTISVFLWGRKYFGAAASRNGVAGVTPKFSDESDQDYCSIRSKRWFLPFVSSLTFFERRMIMAKTSELQDPQRINNGPQQIEAGLYKKGPSSFFFFFVIRTCHPIKRIRVVLLPHLRSSTRRVQSRFLKTPGLRSMKALIASPVWEVSELI